MKMNLDFVEHAHYHNLDSQYEHRHPHHHHHHSHKHHIVIVAEQLNDDHVLSLVAHMDQITKEKKKVRYALNQI